MQAAKAGDVRERVAEGRLRTPKAAGPATKPVSLRPLKFESAMDALLKVKPPKKEAPNPSSAE
jgi:hypothetical protein